MVHVPARQASPTGGVASGTIVGVGELCDVGEPSEIGEVSGELDELCELLAAQPETIATIKMTNVTSQGLRSESGFR
jgi:hypothetical protein